jgi:hypothetical protein
MPFVPEALRFAQNPETTLEQLRDACRLLGLDTSGTAPELRARLLDYLATLDPGEAVVCLNPNAAQRTRSS